MDGFDPAALVDSGLGILARFFGPDKGWAGAMDAGDLDVSSWTRCPLAQLFGDYSRGHDELVGFTGEDYRGFSVRHGFDGPDDDDPEIYYGRCEALTNEWKRRLAEV